jgi:hypothetical protein
MTTLKSNQYLLNPWFFNDEPFLDPTPFAGFVYLITDQTNGKKYIGKKFFWSRRKDPKTKKRVKKESDWKTYFGSNLFLKGLVREKGWEKFRRDILSLHTLIRDVNYTEVKLQYLFEVLEQVDTDGEMKYMNGNISGKHWSHLVRGIEERTTNSLILKTNILNT